MKANGRTYEANYANYFVFLNDFRQDIQSIDYKVDDYICGESKVAMPLSASVVRTYGGMDKYEAVLVLEFNKEGKIVLWQEIYAPCET